MYGPNTGTDRVLYIIWFGNDPEIFDHYQVKYYHKNHSTVQVFIFQLNI